MRILLLLLLGFIPLIEATPAQVIIIRHGEKQDDVLSLKGEQRAAALVPFFLNKDSPAAIYAMKPNVNGKRQRPLLTITPLAQALKLTPNTDFERDDTKGLAEEILSNRSLDGKTVLICWEHKNIPDIAKKLGADDAPKNWHGDAYDRLWIIQPSQGNFRDLPQQLLYKDSSK